MAQQPLMGFLVPSIARRISILSGHADREKNTVKLRVAVSAHPHLEANLRGEEDQAPWQQDYDAAAEIAVTTASLRQMMLYHGALVKASFYKSNLESQKWHPRFMAHT